MNTPSTQGGVGLSTGLAPSFTLGCGAVGGSATSDNVTPMNLLNIRRVAYYLGGDVKPQYVNKPAAAPAASSTTSSGVDIEAIAAMIVAELKKNM